jgi:hypothetical protein
MFDFIFNWQRNTKMRENTRYSFDPLDHLIFTIQENLNGVLDRSSIPKERLSKHNLYEQLSELFTLEDTKIKHLCIPKNQNFDIEYDIIFSGCSQTHADFISQPKVQEGDYNNIWGFQVANNFNKTALNIAVGGRGFYSIIRGVFNQIFRTKNPKAIFLLLPDYGRYTVPFSTNIYPETTSSHDLISHSYLIHVKHEKSISKSPHKIEDIVDVTTPLFFNLQSLLILEGYCKMNNIYLKYASWHRPTSMLLSLLKENTDNYKNFIELDTSHYKNDDPTFVLSQCHEEIKKRFPTIFDVAADGYHMGVHSHTHVAEEFIKEINNDNLWN